MKVTVNDGRVVDDGVKTHQPGDSFECDDKEGKRLVKAKVVSLFKKKQPKKTVTYTNPAERQKFLVEAIASLDPDKSNNKDWTKSEVPQTLALEEILGDGETVSAKERNEAYEIYKAENSNNEKGSET